jgi:hypothetical protein
VVVSAAAVVVTPSVGKERDEAVRSRHVPKARQCEESVGRGSSTLPTEESKRKKCFFTSLCADVGECVHQALKGATEWAAGEPPSECARGASNPALCVVQGWMIWGGEK